MNSVHIRFQALSQTLGKLEESLQLLCHDLYHELYDNLRDSAIKRFTLSVDTFWKFIKVYVTENFSLKIDVVTPRRVLRAAVDVEVITTQEFDQLSSAVRDRNLSSHTYNEDLAEEIVQRIVKHAQVMRTIVQRITVSAPIS